MHQVASVESLWRYPVKSMRGEQLESAFACFAGIHGDRLVAVHDAGAPLDFPYLTGRQRAEMLLFRPRFHNGVASVHAGDLPIDVETPDGACLAIEDPRLLQLLEEGLGERHSLSLMRSESSLTDAYPVSLFSLQTAQQLGEDLGLAIDKRRFRANVYLDLPADKGFGEDQWVGRSVRIGETVVLEIVDRDPRCKMITLDPDTAEASPEVMKQVAKVYEGKAGVYARVLVEGEMRPGDPVCLLG